MALPLIKIAVIGGGALLGLGAVNGALGAFGASFMPSFNLFGISIDWFTALCILAVVIVGIIYGSRNKAILALVVACGVLLLCSTATMNFLDVRADMARQSAVYGTIQHRCLYKDFTVYEIRLAPADLQLMPEGGEYILRRDFNKRYEFDGTSNKFNLLVNDRPAGNTISYAGNLRGFYVIAFFNDDGYYIITIPIEIRLRFLISRIELTISSPVSSNHFGYLQQYFLANGLNLRLIEEQFNPQGGAI